MEASRAGIDQWRKTSTAGQPNRMDSHSVIYCDTKFPDGLQIPLAEQHGYKAAPGAEPASVTLGSGGFNSLLKFMSWEHLQHLT